ncbi:hypothetical protein Bca101_086112 [Brassica carinata]
MLQWGLQTDSQCLLCNSYAESRSHIYFECDYSWAIWSPLALRCGTTRKHILLLAWQGSLYTFWTERNSRLRRDSFRSSSSIISEIDHTIRRRIASLRSAQPTQASALLQMWFSNSPPH